MVFSALALGSGATAPAPRPVVEEAAAQQIGDVAIIGVPWSAYTFLPSKDYTVVGTIVLRDVNMMTFLADLMERAVAMGGHDIKNVRLSVITTEDGEQHVNIATAVAIRFIDETISGAGYVGIFRSGQ